MNPFCRKCQDFILFIILNSFWDSCLWGNWYDECFSAIIVRTERYYWKQIKLLCWLKHFCVFTEAVIKKICWFYYGLLDSPPTLYLSILMFYRFFFSLLQSSLIRFLPVPSMYRVLSFYATIVYITPFPWTLLASIIFQDLAWLSHLERPSLTLCKTHLLVCSYLFPTKH